MQEPQERLIQSALPLAVWIANRYRRRGMSPANLTQEGNIGLLQAVDTFDPDCGRFSIHAVWHIKGRIRSAIMNQARSVRLPNYVVSALPDLYREGRAGHGRAVGQRI